MRHRHALVGWVRPQAVTHQLAASIVAMGIAVLHPSYGPSGTVMGRHQRGMTLIELVISIVIIGIAAAALYAAMASIAGSSADPMLRQQSLAIAEAYLEEILLQPFADPDGLADCGRSCFDDVSDYQGLSEAPHDAHGNALAALASYQVQVQVSAQAWNGLAASDVRQVQVTVTDPAGQQLLLDGYRVSP